MDNGVSIDFGENGDSGEVSLSGIKDASGGGKTYTPFKIPSRGSDQSGEKSAEPGEAEKKIDNQKTVFYEIEYNSHPIPGVGRFVESPQKIKKPEPDEKSVMFSKMRDIARDYSGTRGFYSLFYNRAYRENSKVFYKQGVFMKDFEDDFAGNVQFTQYYPCYELMGYNQLRTYFTWRTNVRRGVIADTSLSYAFLYIYELLANIGVENPDDGLAKLMIFYQAFRAYNKGIDKYVLGWLKDYHIYYSHLLKNAFEDFLSSAGIFGLYPEVAVSDDFGLYCSFSKYDIRKSNFYKNGNEELIKECFYFVLDKLKLAFSQKGIDFDEIMFSPEKGLKPWTPFKNALFYEWAVQPDKRVVLSKDEIYVCQKNKWVYSSAISGESGRFAIGFILKQMEEVLRRAVGYKFKITAGSAVLPAETELKLKSAGLSLGETVKQATAGFYREATKTVVRVDMSSLDKIRAESLVTQEKLTVPEEKPPVLVDLPDSLSRIETPAKPQKKRGDAPLPDVWEELREALTEVEIKALAVLVSGEKDIKAFADKKGVMLEVLFDGINEKSTDIVGDSLTDGEFEIYGEYKRMVKEMVK